YTGHMTPLVWMFIKTYESLRKYIIKNYKIDSLIQMEYSAFEEATVPINAFVVKKEISNSDGTYIRLSDFRGGMEVQRQKTLDAINNPSTDYLYRTNQSNFKNLPGFVIAYWASQTVINSFKQFKSLDNYFDAKTGLQTG
ncbi:BREX-1 system adenine-specific DNA-methyltransferase PglX, partial [Weissella cibaria]|nr:BREX-1 system adenine-specific DNA-methyltransferase PglX [Weissella cibaria]